MNEPPDAEGQAMMEMGCVVYYRSGNHGALVLPVFPFLAVVFGEMGGVRYKRCCSGVPALPLLVWCFSLRLVVLLAAFVFTAGAAVPRPSIGQLCSG